MSRRMPMYSRVRSSGLAKGIPYQPSTTCGPDTPRPRMKRPPDRWSRVIAAIAVAAGWRADICTIAVPRLIRDVDAPHQASGVRQSDPYASAVQIESKPSRSASAIASVTPGGGPPAQPPRARRLGVEHASRNGPLHRLADADDPRQEPAGTGLRDDSATCEYESDPGALGGEAHVHRQRHRDPDADRRAVDRGDHGL